MRVTGYLPSDKYEAFKRKAEACGVTEYALASQAFEIVMAIPKESIKNEEMTKLVQKHPWVKQFLI